MDQGGIVQPHMKKRPQSRGSTASATTQPGLDHQGLADAQDLYSAHSTHLSRRHDDAGCNANARHSRLHDAAHDACPA
ncbi:hypothetical protein HYQ46_011711 [Verticillium longisporum]|nr:hypothetical protein HYQ46_011711 [Verticillium longisporum]